MIDNGYEHTFYDDTVHVYVQVEAPSRYYGQHRQVFRRRWRGGNVTHYQIGYIGKLEWLPVEYLVRHDDGE